MIFDGPKSFPNSCVLFTRFKSFELRNMFAHLRQQEEILQKDVLRLGADGLLEEISNWLDQAPNDPRAQLLRKSLELATTQKVLIWMAHNVTGSAEETALRRRGFGSGEHERMSRVEEDWDKEKFAGLLRRFIGG